jgi:hypothetical protein
MALLIGNVIAIEAEPERFLLYKTPKVQVTGLGKAFFVAIPL